MKVESPDGSYISMETVKDPDGECRFEIAIRTDWGTTISRHWNPETLETFAEELRKGAQILREQQAKEARE